MKGNSLDKKYFITVLIIFGVIIIIICFFLIRSYMFNQVQRRVRDVMLECRAFHEYVQEDLHTTWRKLMDEGRLKQGFYSPEMLSSSCITRNYQKYYNSERIKLGLPPVQYKMAALDPRNSLNTATPEEAQLIALFNENKELTEYDKIVKSGKTKYFLYATPFLKIEQRCLVCHGRPQDAPAELQEYYQWEGGFNKQLGDISAVEIIKSPLQGEYSSSSLIFALTAAGVCIFLVLFYMNSRLKVLVSLRTQALKTSEERLSLALKGASLGTWDWNLSSGEFTVNTGWGEQMKDKPGKWIRVQDTGKFIEWDEKGFPVRACGIHQDITQIQKDLEEKKLLLKEIHHRVKNNLQIICSLLRLQSAKLDNPELKESFKDCISRVFSMVLVHERLYKSKDFAKVDMKQYGEQMTREILNTFANPPNITVKLKIDNIEIGIDTAIPCGMILNELVTNALKYAFPENRDGVVTITMSRTNDECTLLVEDNGIGIPGEINIIGAETLGFQLIDMLTSQLSGQCSVSSKTGTAFRITFPLGG